MEQKVVEIFSSRHANRHLFKQIKDQLKVLKGVNQKAVVTYTFTQEKLKDMKGKMVHFNNSHRRCLELVQNVEDMKSSAIQYSLMQVARAFRQMFKTMVPRPGIGHLRWTYGSNGGDSDDEDENVPQANIFVSVFHFDYV